jgi:small subunit ribosomal protein S4
LKDEDLLERRLPTILLNKKMANTPKHARQMVVHKKILINEKIVDAPGYLVNVNEESEIRLKEKTRKITNKESKESEEGKAAENKNVKSDEKVIEADSVIQTEPDKNEFKEEKS